MKKEVDCVFSENLKLFLKRHTFSHHLLSNRSWCSQLKKKIIIPIKSNLCILCCKFEWSVLIFSFHSSSLWLSCCGSKTNLKGWNGFDTVQRFGSISASADRNLDKNEAQIYKCFISILAQSVQINGAKKLVFQLDILNFLTKRKNLLRLSKISKLVTLSCIKGNFKFKD